ncbi:hypothetical protein [Thermodesulfovibrio hydrogeniphilus]
MILSVLIVHFEVGRRFLADRELIGAKFIKSADAMGAVIITAFIDGAGFRLFPFKEGIATVRAEVFRV